MLFNSFEFIILFLPISIIIYFLLNKYRFTAASKSWLVLSSLFFYSWWNVKYLPLILGSIIFNYAVGTSFAKAQEKRKYILLSGIMANVLLLGYFKYADFFITTINSTTGSGLSALNVILPLGISFFTFTQIAYLVDSYRSEAKEYDFLNYSLFITFFPHLLAGPIIHHKEMMPQFDRTRNKVLSYRNVAMGLYLFFIGLSKKVLIADSFAVYANNGFDVASSLALIEAWVASLSYTIQIYFDFSGYTDMALGCALMFNIRLPRNFNSPYKALDIQDFWRRWHVTLSRFLRDYIYIPLGGNRVSEFGTISNLLITFLIGGLWHGAGWTFVFWGLLHGTAAVVHRVWKKVGRPLPKALAWFLTFNFINIAWVFFRARNWEDAVKVLKGMAGLNEIILPVQLENVLAVLKDYGVSFGHYLLHVEAGKETLLGLIFFLIVAFFFKNSNEMMDKFRPTFRRAAFMAFLIVVSLMSVLLINSTEFLYFNF